VLALWIPDASPQAVGLNCERRRSLTVAKRPLASSEEKREPASDINTAVVDSLKVLDPKRPIREADMERDIPTLPSRAMCGRLLVGKGFLRVCSIGRSSHVFGL